MTDETSFAGLLSDNDDDSSRTIPRLPEIGEGTLAVLRRAGIFTARDVLNKRSLRALPGIGPGREAVLLEWAERNLTKADVVYFTKQREERRKLQLIIGAIVAAYILLAFLIT